MYRLLIVDDEPYTVDGLYEMLQNEAGGFGEDAMAGARLPELDLYRAYSAIEAIDWLNRAKIDIVLSDIRMPGMDGLQLLKEIRARWPRCKVLFLTGMNGLPYVQQALRDGSVDYILKTEGDEPILRGIRKAAETIREELRNDRILQDARTKVREAIPSLRSQWFRKALLHGLEDSGLTASRMAELDCSLDAGKPLLPVLARVDRWPEGSTATDRKLLQYAIENMLTELFDRVVLQIVPVDDYYLMALIQPKDGRDRSLGEALSSVDSGETMLAYVRGTLETAQAAVAEWLRLPLSVACGRGTVAWEELAVAYYRMRRKLVLGVGDGESMHLMTGPGGASGRCGGSSPMLLPRQRERLDAALESGRAAEAQEAISACFDPSGDYAGYLEAYYTVANQLIGFMNRWGWQDRLAETIGLERLVDVKGHPTREAAVDFLREAAGKLVAFKKGAQEEKTDWIVDKVNRHIRDRVGGDLSLNALAELVYLNPAYLSVLYKQMTGSNISEVVARVRLEKAKELLADAQLKIHEIASAVGFDNAGYFARFFRKHIGIGPQEYRDQTIR